MRRFFQRALSTPAEGLRVLTAPAPRVSLERLIDAEIGAPLLLWDAPQQDPGPRFAYVGFGEAARIEASGEGRFDELLRGARALFASLTEQRHPDLEAAPAPRLFGGLAFRPEASRPPPWAGFGDASFVMPRWLYGASAEGAFLQLAVRAGERVDPAEIERVLAALQDESRSAPSSNGARNGERNGAPAGARLVRTSPADWDAMILDALARIRAHELEKVVPMALCRVNADRDLDVACALARVRAAYPECSSFAFQRGSAIFLGASPERLVSRRGDAVHADALAGSRARVPGEDERAVRELLASDKDRREHHVVVLAVERALRPFAEKIRAPEEPRVRSLRNVHHLFTPIEATLARPAHVLELVRALHPTPAVCGTPKVAALAWIAAHEPAPRGWYAGAVGWFDAAGDGAFSVAIRSGVLDRREAWLYAGAGIVEGSDPGAEYAETRVKQAPMLDALGLLS